jgi:hypothetical protein
MCNIIFHFRGHVVRLCGNFSILSAPRSLQFWHLRASLILVRVEETRHAYGSHWENQVKNSMCQVFGREWEVAMRRYDAVASLWLPNERWIGMYRVFQKELYNDIPNATVWRVLRKLLHLKAYKLSIVQGVERWIVCMPLSVATQ